MRLDRLVLELEVVLLGQRRLINLTESGPVNLIPGNQIRLAFHLLLGLATTQLHHLETDVLALPVAIQPEKQIGTVLLLLLEVLGHLLFRLGLKFDRLLIKQILFVGHLFPIPHLLGEFGLVNVPAGAGDLDPAEGLAAVDLGTVALELVDIVVG